jgi:hypothetical protein
MKKLKLFTALIIILLSFSLSVDCQTPMTFGQIYDFDINDEFHFHYPDVPTNAQRIKITGKFFTISLDSVCYIRQNNNYYSQVNWQPSPHLEYFFNSYIDTVCYTNLNTICDSAYINWPLGDSLDSEFYETLYYSPNLCGSLVYEYFACGYCSFESYNISVQYGQGLGMTKYSEQYNIWPPTGFRHQMKYFKKGSITCGTPDTTTQNIPESTYNTNKIQVFPNPVTNEIYLVSDFMNSALISIYNANGILIKQIERFEHNKSIDISTLKEGIYFLKIESENIIYQSNFIKQ